MVIRLRIVLFAPVAIVLGLALTGCKAQYPACNVDRDCKDKEFCVDRKCQQCRNSWDCGHGLACNVGLCSPIPGYCHDRSECPGGRECFANHCRGCLLDSECSSGTRCDQGSCIKGCARDSHCPLGQDCVDGACAVRRNEP